MYLPESFVELINKCIKLVYKNKKEVLKIILAVYVIVLKRRDQSQCI